MKEKEFDVRDFLKINNISLESYDFKADLEIYLKEMQTGLDAESSIPMLPTYIEEGGKLPSGRPVLVLDAGGTNFRAAVVTFDEEGTPEISNFRKRGMPGVDREHTRIEFFDAIADFILDLAPLAERIGFCFSYPMVKTADKDGRLLGFSKEIKAEEVVGELIGEGVLEALERKGISHIRKIVLLNDTVATLLAGKAGGDDDAWDGHIGFIYGTGVNTCYDEKNSNIGKVDGLSSTGSQLINMESGSCSAIASGAADLAFRNTTARPTAYVFEKMVSGGYLGSLWFSVLRTAAGEGCFSSGFSAALDAASESGEARTYDAAVVSILLSDGILPEALAEGVSETDMQRVLEITRAIIARAAYLAALMLTAIMVKTGKGKNPDKPVCICADGTTFWKLHGLKEQVAANLDKFTAGAGVYYVITQMDNAPVIGAAVAGLTND